MSSLQHLFNPRGIAVIGASADRSRPGTQCVVALAQRGYRGGVYPVNPKYEDIAGLKCYSSIAEVPRPCDLAVIALPAALVPQTVAACGDSGVRFAVVLGGGFREAGEEGKAIEAELSRIAREKGVRLVGPNCLGLLNVHDHVYAGFGSLIGQPPLSAGGVSAVIQSGGFGNSLVMRCGASGIGFRHVVASGNETDLASADLIDAFVDDPQTRAILVYLEGVRDGRAFMAAARRALAAGKPVLVWKAGNSRQGMRAAASHTANMTGSYDVFRAAFRQCGVIEIRNVEDIVDYLKALLADRPALGRNVAVMGGSGGSAVVFSDAADQYGLSIAPLAPETQATLTGNLPSIASLDNPIDWGAGFLGDATAPRFLAAVEAVLADPGIDQFAMMMATVTGHLALIIANTLAEVAKRSVKPILVFSASPRHASAPAYEILERAGIPILGSPSRIAQTMGMLADYQQALETGRSAGATAFRDRVIPELPDTALDEHRSKQLISAFGIAVTDDRVFPAQAIDVRDEDLSFPVVVKIISPDIPHKSDIGGVALNVADAAALSAASRAVLQAVGKAAPAARLCGLLVSPMVGGGLETIVGIVNDDVFGPVVAFGLGGIFTEVLHDMTYRVAPFAIDEARSMIAELRSSRMFDGVRGQPARDVGALAETLVAVSELAWQMRGRLAELDINPLLVLAQGRGVVAADALAVLRSRIE